jgi:hypothetical protein
VNDALRSWFDVQGLMRYAASCDEYGNVSEVAMPPLIALGPADHDFVLPPDPGTVGYSGKPLAEMTLTDFNRFIYRWFERAVEAHLVRCANCGKLLRNGDDIPPEERWDALFLEKELVGWMLVHFDCKRWLAKRLKGLQPFELEPGPPPVCDLSGIETT